MSTIDEIKARIDIVDLVSETVKLRRTGKNYVGFCPFHANTRTPAFAVFQDSGTWRCFGQCNEGGDIFKFVMKKEGWDFPQALKYLAERAGVQLQPVTPQAEKAAEAHERLGALLDEAVVFYRHQLLHTPAGQKALDYLHQRGLRDEIIATFDLGYAPDAWEAAYQHFTARGYSQDDLLEAGLATEREGGGAYDRFRNRILFPIRDAAGKMAGFGARILNPNDSPKFINSPQTALFDKGRLLYGLDQARKAIRAQDQVVIVEGYLDVIALHQGGFTNTVSPMGTALTEDQMRLLKRFSRRIVLALDADAAGEKATLRGLELARQALDHTAELVFDARGLLRHEARLQADLRVTALPEGLDPDDVVNHDPAEWKRIIEEARPVVVHVMETLSAGRDLADARVKSEIAAQVLPLIEDVANPVERDTYRQKLARLLRVDERALAGARPAAIRQRRTRRAYSRQAKEPTPVAPLSPTQANETYCLKILLRHPVLLFALDRALQEAGVAPLSDEDFTQTGYQILFRLIRQSLEQDDLDPQPFIFSQVPESLAELANSLVEPPKPPEPAEPEESRLSDDLSKRTMQLRQQHVNSSLNQLRFLEEDAQAQGDLQAADYREVKVQFIQTLNRLNRALGRSPIPNN
ncbi:MAG: DNA primase [Chloroflexi bacterium]|nr:DNA primase [Chloroflexota bacterium]